MRPLPVVTSLSDAVARVIESNKSDGYQPTRFVAVTGNGHAPDLLAVCERLILKGETLEYLDKALERFPTLLTLEDLVARYGAGWGFSQETIEVAKARVNSFAFLSHLSRSPSAVSPLSFFPPPPSHFIEYIISES